jgi:rRNA pseudouridine-1189 N-methylase Emg1 (Nep1/Mra1 family)
MYEPLFMHVLLLHYEGTSFHTDNLVKVKDIVPADEPITIVVGGMAHGSVS